MCETKVCKECKKELPMNTDYFFKKKDTVDGFANKCKVCQGYNYTDKLTKIPKQGYKFCIKCDRELKANASYFTVDNTCKDGLRNVCRECGKDGHFMSDDYIPKHIWTDEENKLFIERYPNYTNAELIEIFYPYESEKDLWDRAYRLGVVKSEETYWRGRKLQAEKLYGVDSPLYNYPKSEETRKKISKALKGKNNYWYGKKRSLDQRLYLSKIKKELEQWKGNKNPRHIDPLKGERNGNWHGGISELHTHLRRNIGEWKELSMKNCDYKCVISGGDFDDIHHTYSFDNIVRDTLENLNLEIKSKINEYTKEELQSIEEECLRIHMNNLGVCLKREIHILFHKMYGYGNNTPEQFEEFKIKYESGEFKDVS